MQCVGWVGRRKLRVGWPKLVATMDWAKENMVVYDLGSITVMIRTVSWKHLRCVGWVGKRKLRLNWPK